MKRVRQPQKSKECKTVLRKNIREKRQKRFILHFKNKEEKKKQKLKGSGYDPVSDTEQ